MRSRAVRTSWPPAKDNNTSSSLTPALWLDVLDDGIPGVRHGFEHVRERFFELRFHFHSLLQVHLLLRRYVAGRGGQTGVCFVEQGENEHVSLARRKFR